MVHFIKTTLSLLLVLLPGGWLYAAPDEARLLSDLDIPLMQDFQEEEDSRVVFDTPEGRIIEVRAVGPYGAGKVLDYYRLVLPSLAWREVAHKNQSCGGSLSFCITARRGGEILTLKIRPAKGTEGKTIIYFSVNPE